MSKVRIFLDAGHGGSDSGAVYGKRKESVDVLKVVLAVGKKLEKQYDNVKVGYSRTSDIYETPSKKADDANTFGADYFFSFHRNFTPGAKGWETEYKSHSTVKDNIMNDLKKEMKKIGFVIREDKKRDNLAVLNQTVAPALLFEIGFIDSQNDNEIFDDHFEEIVNAFVRVIGNNCGLKEVKTMEKKKGYFSINKNADNIAEFLHNRGYGAGEHNLSMIAAANAKTKEVKKALFDLAEKGELKKPDGLNEWDGK